MRSNRDTGKRVVDTADLFPDVDRETDALAIPHVRTVIYDTTLRTPARPVETRFPIMKAFDLGVDIDIIPYTLAQGATWKIGLVRDAESSDVIWLSDLNLPYDQQIAAWWVM